MLLGASFSVVVRVCGCCCFVTIRIRFWPLYWRWVVIMADGLCGLKTQATKPLRQVMSVTGVQLEEYALHPQRIEGATHLSPAGASSQVLKRDGRWASGVYQGYVHNQGETHRGCPERW